jgi:4-amino-4-deoxy-L-arabinose transferase-like glycosyltransferase
MIFIISILLGIFLRVYKIGANYYFTGELGKELLYIRHFIQAGSLPLTGLPTSHEWLTYGPIYYWILIPLTKIFGQSPYILFWLSLAVSIAGIFITYWVFSKIIDKKFAVILSFFISLSPLLVWATRLSKLHTFFFVLIPLTIYFLYKLWNRKNKYVFWLGIVFGLLFSFHYSQIPILVVILLAFWIKRKNLKIGNYLKFITGLIIPNITILIYDFQNGFSMTKNLFLWIPYRVAGFLGLYPKNNLNVASGVGTLNSFNEFFGRNLFWDSRIWILGSIIFIILFVSFAYQNYKKFTKDFLTFYLISSTIVQCLALLVLTTPPIHYFFPIFLNFGILLSFYISQYWQRKSTRVLTVMIFVLMFVAGILGLGKEHVGDTGYTPLSTQEEVTDAIIKDAAGRPFSLVRVGPFDYFPDNYSQNYQFLILSKGGSISLSAKLRYIIYDIGGVYVQKNEPR